MLVQPRASAVVRLRQGDQGDSVQHSPMSTRVSSRNTEELQPSEEVAVVEAFVEAEEGPLADIMVAHLSEEFMETEEWHFEDSTDGDGCMWATFSACEVWNDGVQSAPWQMLGRDWAELEEDKASAAQSFNASIKESPQPSSTPNTDINKVSIEGIPSNVRPWVILDKMHEAQGSAEQIRQIQMPDQDLEQDNATTAERTQTNGVAEPDNATLAYQAQMNGVEEQDDLAIQMEPSELHQQLNEQI